MWTAQKFQPEGYGSGGRFREYESTETKPKYFSTQKEKKKSFFLFCTEVTGLCVMQLGCCKMWLFPWGNYELGLRAKNNFMLYLFAFFFCYHTFKNITAIPHSPTPLISLSFLWIQVHGNLSIWYSWICSFQTNYEIWITWVIWALYWYIWN